MASKLEHALALAARGFRVFPIAPGKKAPPLLAGWPDRATSDPAVVKDYWVAVPDANIGIHCEGMIVVDVDVKNGGYDSLNLLEIQHGFPSTLVTQTPTGGQHIFYKSNDRAANSVGALGRGLDIRSYGGYVVGPGSTVAAGDYSFGIDAPIADAPAWLVHKLGAFTEREHKEKVNVVDAPDAVVDRAREWLCGQLPAIQGAGGDAQTFKVACGLRDVGVSAAQAFALMQDSWNATCAPPWNPGDLQAKVDGAYLYGQNAPGARAALPDDFPIVQYTEQNSANVQPERQNVNAAVTTAHRLSAFANSIQKGPGYLVKGVLQRRTYAELFGAPGEGKTFVALDMAYHIAAGLPWMGHKVHAGTVLYLAYEGTGGLVKRAQALRQKYGAADVPLYVANAAYNLRERPGRQALGCTLADLPAKPVLIVIDTFARALMGGDENSAQDVGAFNSGVAALIENTGACVMIIHHSGKNKSAGARGSSALLGAIDTELEVDSGQVWAKKQRDIELTDPIAFKLVPLVVGLDEDGDDLTSCVVEAGTAVSSAQNPSGRLSGNAKRGFDKLCVLAPDNAPVAEHDWKNACLEFLGSKSTSQRFYDMKVSLVKKGFIVVDEKSDITRSMK